MKILNKNLLYAFSTTEMSLNKLQSYKIINCKHCTLEVVKGLILSHGADASYIVSTMLSKLSHEHSSLCQVIISLWVYF